MIRDPALVPETQKHDGEGVGTGGGRQCRHAVRDERPRKWRWSAGDAPRNPKAAISTQHPQTHRSTRKIGRRNADPTLVHEGGSVGGSELEEMEKNDLEVILHAAISRGGVDEVVSLKPALRVGRWRSRWPRWPRRVGTGRRAGPRAGRRCWRPYRPRDHRAVE